VDEGLACSTFFPDPNHSNLHAHYYSGQPNQSIRIKKLNNPINAAKSILMHKSPIDQIQYSGQLQRDGN
jgi:hypothetical protein